MPFTYQQEILDKCLEFSCNIQPVEGLSSPDFEALNTSNDNMTKNGISVLDQVQLGTCAQQQGGGDKNSIGATTIEKN